jgi:hypothetical protein
MVAEPARRFASSTNPETWRGYETALACYEAGRFPGIGRVIERGGGLVGIDIDGCRCPHTGRIDDRGRRLLDSLDSYSEVSPSGTGVKVWVRADLGRSYVKEGLEVYSGGRYFTVTGQILSQYSEGIEERAGTVHEIVASEFPRPERQRCRGSYSGPCLDLDAVLEGAGVDILAEFSDGQAARKYRVLCPWVEHHTIAPETGTIVGQYPDGALFFWCWHAHCRGRRWREFRRAITRPVRRAADYLEVRVSYGR